MRHQPSIHPSNIAFEVDADFIDADGCACPLCRPHGALLSFVSRDDLRLVDAPAPRRFDRQRLTHCFTVAAQMPTPHSGTDFGRWTGHGKLTYRHSSK